MNTPKSGRRRYGQFVARAGVIGSALMFMVTAWSWLIPADAAATNAGNATVVDPSTNQPKASGGSATDFTIKLPTSSACTGDSTNAGYRVQSYMVPSSVDPASLQFDSTGPAPNGFGSSFRQPLYDSTSNPYVNAQTATATTPGGPGPIINIPTFNFNVYEAGQIPAGPYNVGIACTKGAASATQLDKYWNVQMTFTTAASDRPAQVTWTAANAAPSTTTTTAASGGSTTTTAAGATTSTTNPGGTTTTTNASGGSTTTTAASGGTTTTTISATATATDSSGAAIAANSTLTGGQSLTISGTGFTPGETVTAAANSTPVTLGTVVADSTGKATASVVIPTSLAAGAHTLTLTGASKTATFPFTIAGSSPGSTSGSSSGSSNSAGPSLPLTGSDPWGMLVWAALLVVFGRMAMLLGRPTRTRR
jgi:hypothetical protein